MPKNKKTNVASSSATSLGNNSVVKTDRKAKKSKSS